MVPRQHFIQYYFNLPLSLSTETFFLVACVAALSLLCDTDAARSREFRNIVLSLQFECLHFSTVCFTERRMDSAILFLSLSSLDERNVHQIRSELLIST